MPRKKSKKAHEAEDKPSNHHQTKSIWTVPLKKTHSNAKLIEVPIVSATNHRKQPSSNFILTYYNDQPGSYNSRSLERALDRAAKGLLERKKSQENTRSLLRKIQAESSRQQNELLVSAISGNKEYVNINISIGPKKTKRKKSEVLTKAFKTKEGVSKPLKNRLTQVECLFGHLSADKNVFTRKSSAANGLLHAKESEPVLVKSRSMKSISIRPSMLDEHPQHLTRERSPKIEKSRKSTKMQDRKGKGVSIILVPDATEARSIKKKSKTLKHIPIEERDTIAYTYSSQKYRPQMIAEPPTTKNPSFKKKIHKDTIASNLISVHR